MKKIIVLLITILAVTIPSQSQDKKEIRAQEQVVQKSYIDSLLQTKRYMFIPDRAITSLPNMPFVNLSSGNYYFKVDNDSIVSELPFYGSATSAPYGSANSPLSFISNSFNYKTRVIKKKKYENNFIEIHAVPAKVDVNNFDITIEVTNSGSATMNVRGTNLSNMSFYGRIEPIKN